MSSISSQKKNEWIDNVIKHLVSFGFGPKERAADLFERHEDKIGRMCWATRESPRRTAEFIVQREGWVLGINAAKSRPVRARKPRATRRDVAEVTTFNSHGRTLAVTNLGGNRYAFHILFSRKDPRILGESAAMSALVRFRDVGEI